MCTIRTVPYPQGLRVLSCRALLVTSVDTLSHANVRFPLLYSGLGSLKLQHRLCGRSSSVSRLVYFGDGLCQDSLRCKRPLSVRNASERPSYQEAHDQDTPSTSKGGCDSDADVSFRGSKGWQYAEVDKAVIAEDEGQEWALETLGKQQTLDAQASGADESLQTQSSTHEGTGSSHEKEEAGSQSKPGWNTDNVLKSIDGRDNATATSSQSESSVMSEDEGIVEANPRSPAGVLAMVWEALKQNVVVELLSRWPAWQQKKKLERALALADANPKDASKQAALLAELYKQSPEAVIERFERREHAANGKAVVEYLRALVATNVISEYLPDERTGRTSGLPALVEPKASNKSMRFVQELISTVLFMIIFGIMWVMGAAALRKYVNGIAGMGSSGGMTGNNVYAPKEFNKETIPEKNAKTFKDVKGCDEAKAELEEIVEYLRKPAKFTRLGGKLPKAIAGEAGVPFFYRAGSEFEEMFVGVGARRVRSLFQAAKKKAPCIVFIDEIDAVGGSRKQWEGHTKKTLNQLLVEMDGFEPNEGIIVLAATNLPETLDPALTRPGRFDRHVVVTNPDVRGRQEILDLYLQDKPLGDDVDVRMLARGTPGFSGADLANLVNMAAVKAAVDGIDKITTNQLEFAKDKLLMGTERKSMSLTEESRKLTAYHESGHAVVAFNTAGANPIHKATITPRGVALGMVTQLPDKDETSISKRQMLARLDVCMGGRVAEEMIFGPDQVTSGARSDLQQATALARHMVSECGMSDTVGPIFIDTESQRPSHDIQKSIDAEVVRLLKEAYERVRNLLKKHEADLHALARALLENETLNAKEVRQILSHPLEQGDEVATVSMMQS
ncbi:hypothetical protein BDL97_13G079400 [Sphagnum fallax]|nr:hypothetical protein BDL97_13G079400 [Sphagnum fallax]